MQTYSYYTPEDLATSLLELLPDVKISTIVDICCGSWNLLKSAKRVYPNANITGVDIDGSLEKHKIEGARFCSEDGRVYAQEMKKIGKTFDLILSNPPFGHISKNSRVYTENCSLFNECYRVLLNSRYEGEMVQANMFLAHDGSFLLFVLPSTFIDGESMQNARSQIAEHYKIYGVVELPSDTFGKEGINTYAVIMKKGISPPSTTYLYKAIYEHSWTIREIGEMSYDDVRRGNWWYYINTKGEGNIVIKRGKISSNEFKSEGEIVLHSAAKTKANWEPSVRYYDGGSINRGIVRAQIGDILINRVGRDAGYWYQNTIENVAVSDCIIVVKNNNNHLVRNFVTNSNSDGRLKIPKRGVTVQYLTIKDIKNVINVV